MNNTSHHFCLLLLLVSFSLFVRGFYSGHRASLLGNPGTKHVQVDSVNGAVFFFTVPINKIALDLSVDLWGFQYLLSYYYAV